MISVDSGHLLLACTSRPRSRIIEAHQADLSESLTRDRGIRIHMSESVAQRPILKQRRAPMMVVADQQDDVYDDDPAMANARDHA